MANALADRRFARFIDYLLADPAPARIAARLQSDGADLLRVFVGLRIYIEGRSVTEERIKRGKEHLKIINRGVRANGVSPEVARWLRDRSELAHSTNGFNRVHNVDSLAAVHIYLQEKTQRRVSMTELAHLTGAAHHALGRKTVSDPVELGRELRRHAKRFPRFVKILKNDITNSL